jgi:4-hydroxybenzoate polyprenyltransferase
MAVGMMDLVKAYLHTCRYEYFPGEAPAMLVPLLLVSDGLGDMLHLNMVLGLAAFLLLFLSGFTINAYTDRKLDETYDSFKRNISRSVNVIGARRLLHLTIAQVAVALVLSGIVAYRMDSWGLYALVLVGVFLGIGYSVKPFNFKERGSVWHAVALGVSIFFIPLLFLYYIAAGEINSFVLILAVGFSLVHYAMEYGNQANDYIEDRAGGVLTPPVRLGIANSLWVAFIMFVVGGIIVDYSFFYLVFHEEALLSHYSVASLWLMVLAIWAIIAAGYFIPGRGLWRMWALSATTEDLERDMPLIRQECHYSRWQTSGILALLVASFIVFGTNLVMVEVTVEPAQGPTFAGTPTTSVVKVGTLFPNYYVDTTLFVRSETLAVDGGTLQIEIRMSENGAVYGTRIINVTNRLIPRETWTRYVRLDVRDRSISTISFTLLSDDDSDGEFTSILDTREVVVRVLPERGEGPGDGGGGILPSPTPDDGTQQPVTPWDWWYGLPLPLGGR